LNAISHANTAQENVALTGFVAKCVIALETPLSGIHHLQESKVRILPSTILGRGTGLFAMKRGAEPNETAFNKGNIIVT
jgi:hypothetical protein